MNSLVRTFCLICIISSGSTISSPLEESEDRNFIPRAQKHFQEASENRIRQTEIAVSEGFKDRQEILHDLADRESQKINHKRHQSPYWRERSHEYYSRLNRNNPDTQRPDGTRIFRTYGRGKAEVTRQGQTVNVSNEFRRNNGRGPANGLEKNENETKSSRRGICRECPTDQTVIASKGNAFAILPEPCPSNPKMWNHHSGPRPGSKIQGGHTIRGHIGPKKKFCQYNYHVTVQHCKPLKSEGGDTTVECSAENYWGSVCNVTCGYEKEPLGPTHLECTDDLTWSNPLPLCKSRMDCSTPKMKAKSKITCQTVDMTEVQGDIIPNGSICKFRQNENDVSINCKDGKWRIMRKSKSLRSKKNKQREKSKHEKNDSCNPSPCQNGGICLRPESNKGPPLCKCRPQTRGVHCELRECYYNICENDGLCFFLNEERICYCAPEYGGDTCQNYTPQ